MDDYFQPDQPAYGTAVRGVHVVGSGPAADVYAVGGVGYNDRWAGKSLVRKSTDGGASWSVVDEFDFDAGALGGGGANAVTADAAEGRGSGRTR
ncbi:MAG TPA: hypothetical protein VFB66_12125 [Tepidisphaeraceae bacterium]|nr:hypothetical protein [Tepidisphaeraceae bacterium]